MAQWLAMVLALHSGAVLWRTFKMKIRTPVLMAFAAFILTTSSAFAQITDVTREFANLTAGSFTTAAQAKDDAAYAEVEAEVVRIWPDRTDGIWMYQEQAIISYEGKGSPEAKSRPYFQRIFRLMTTGDKILVRENYELADPSVAVGAYKDPAKLASITPKDLILGGCANRIERVAKGYWRANITTCANTYKDATHMTSLSVYTDDTLANWDRGFDANGKVVWGPEGGGYIFKRK